MTSLPEIDNKELYQLLKRCTHFPWQFQTLGDGTRQVVGQTNAGLKTVFKFLHTGINNYDTRLAVLAPQLAAEVLILRHHLQQSGYKVPEDSNIGLP